MAITLRTNVASLGAQRALLSTQAALDSSLSRLSRGFRITNASDDAAGLGISTKLESQLRSQNQAVRNANDGVSVMQTAEAGLGEQANILTRLRELAMQAASDGVGNVERGYIDKEAQKLVSELQRISSVTEFNGTKLLDGTAGTMDFQVGIENAAASVVSVTPVDLTGRAFAPGFVSAAGNVYLGSLMAAPGDQGAAAAAIASASAARTDAAAFGAAGQALYYVYQTALLESGGSVEADQALVAATVNGGTGGDPLLSAAYSAFQASMTSSSNWAAAQSDAAVAASAVAAQMGLPAGAGGSPGPAAAAASHAAFWIFHAGYAGVAGGYPQGQVVAPGSGLDAGVAVSRLALTDRAWSGETDRDLGVIGVGEFEHDGVTGLVRPS